MDSISYFGGKSTDFGLDRTTREIRWKSWFEVCQFFFSFSCGWIGVNKNRFMSDCLIIDTGAVYHPICKVIWDTKRNNFWQWLFTMHVQLSEEKEEKINFEICGRNWSRIGTMHLQHGYGNKIWKKSLGVQSRGAMNVRKMYPLYRNLQQNVAYCDRMGSTQWHLYL